MLIQEIIRVFQKLEWAQILLLIFGYEWFPLVGLLALDWFVEERLSIWLVHFKLLFLRIEPLCIHPLPLILVQQILQEIVPGERIHFGDRFQTVCVGQFVGREHRGLEEADAQVVDVLFEGVAGVWLNGLYKRGYLVKGSYQLRSETPKILCKREIW